MTKKLAAMIRLKLLYKFKNLYITTFSTIITLSSTYLGNQYVSRVDIKTYLMFRLILKDTLLFQLALP